MAHNYCQAMKICLSFLTITTKNPYFELQWVYQPGVWGVQNSMPAYLDFSPDIANGDGWGGDKGASWWMLSQYEGIQASGDTMLKGRTIDTRLKATFMLPGASYPEITQTVPVTVNPAGKQKLIVPNTNGDPNFAVYQKICGRKIRGCRRGVSNKLILITLI